MKWFTFSEFVIVLHKRGCLVLVLGCCFSVVVLFCGMESWDETASSTGVCDVTKFFIVTTGTYGFLYSLVYKYFFFLFYSVRSLQWISASRHNARNLRGHQSEVTLHYAKLYLFILLLYFIFFLLYFYQQLLKEGQLVQVVKKWWETVCDKDHIRMSLQMRWEVLSYVALTYSGEK